MVDTFYLDTRNGYLGRSQTEWLSEKLLSSAAKWKLIFYGLPLCSTSHDIPVRDGNTAIHIRTNFDDEDSGRGEARVSIQVEDEEEAHADKYSLLSVLSALSAIFANNDAEELNMQTPATQVTDASSSESGLALIKTGIVVISGGRSKYNSVPSGPYVITFTPRSTVDATAHATDINPYYAEIYVGGEESTPVVQLPLFSSETANNLLWSSASSPHFSSAKLFLDGEGKLRVEIWSVSDNGLLSMSDLELLRATNAVLCPRLLFSGALDASTQSSG